MTDKPENPPAFPWSYAESTLNGGHGMALRDWFAGQALATSTLADDRDAAEWVARRCYEYADAMLAAREQSQ